MLNYIWLALNLSSALLRVEVKQRGMPLPAGLMGHLAGGIASVVIRRAVLA